MDLILLVGGGILWYLGTQRKDENGEIEPGGKTMRTIGTVMCIIGGIIALLGFFVGLSLAVG